MSHNKEEFLKALARCRLMEADKAVDWFGLTGSDIDSLLSERLISTEKHEQGGESKSCYTLSEKGESYITHEVSDVNHVYRGFIAEQDLELMSFYAKLPLESRQTWITKDDYIVQYQQPGTVDGAYRDKEGNLVAIKVVSAKAPFSSVERVEQFLKHTGIEHIHYLTYQPKL